MRVFRRIWQEVNSGQNLDIYINIALTVVVATLGIFGIVNQSIVSSVTLVILALLLTSLLVNRHNSETIQSAISKLEKPENFLNNKYERHELTQALHTAHKAFFWGLDFATTIPSLSTDIQQGITVGLEVRFLLVKPESSAGKMAILARPEQTLEEFNDAIKKNLNHLSRLASNASPGKLEFRTIDYYPAFNITAFDPHLPTGWMLVRMVSFRERFPTFKLTRANDEKWFMHIVQQFEAVWGEANEVSQSR